METTHDAIVIGAGLGGLTAGALLSQAGARVLVLERNASLGGAATTYHRGALTIEASLHETTHPFAPGDPKRVLFEALDMADDLALVAVPDLHEVRWHGLGAPFTLPHGLPAVEAALTARFPEQRANIRAFLRQVRRTLRLAEFLSPEHGVGWKALHAAELPLDLWSATRDVTASLSDVYARHFGEDEAIKIALCANLPYFTDDPDRFWWLGFAMAQGGYLQGGGYYIRGGSQLLSDRLAEAIRAAGGALRPSCPATAVELGPDGAAAAVRWREAGGGGPEQRATTRCVIANAAPHAVAGMLPETAREAFMAPYAGRPLSISLVSATLGLDRPAAEFGVSAYSTVLVPEWLRRFSEFPAGTALFGAAPGERLPVLCIVDYGQIDSGLGPAPGADGLHPLAVVAPDRLENWQGLEAAAYRARREAWLDAIVARLDAEWPGLAGAVRARTMTTARSLHDHLGTPGGAVYGFALEPPATVPRQPTRRVESAVPGLWISSAFTGFGGFTGAIGAGIAAARAALGADPDMAGRG